VFNSLGKDEIFKIIDLSLRGVKKRLTTMGFQLNLSVEAKEFLSEKGYDPQFGARPLNRAIQKYIEDPLAEFILGEQPTEGTHFEAVMNDEKDGLRIVRMATELVDEEVAA
jgi:ATP-dependent Clp protease ATP-binding subunit ClpC